MIISHLIPKLVLSVALLFSFISAGFACSDHAKPVQSLTSFEWKQRIILLKGDADTAQARSELELRTAELAERDVLWFILGSDSTEAGGGGLSNVSPEMRSRITEEFALNVNQAFFGTTPSGVVLIGKDGGTKARMPKLEFDALLALIDAMPMRQAEMQDKVTGY